MRTLCDQPFTAENRIRVMSDCHVDKSCMVGRLGLKGVDKNLPRVLENQLPHLPEWGILEGGGEGGYPKGGTKRI